jgi:hypothetical protein
VDVLTTAPVLCGPGIAVLEAAAGRAGGTLLRQGGAAVIALRLAFVASAAAAMALLPGWWAASLVPFCGGAAAVTCALVLPPLLLLLGAHEVQGTCLVTTSALERVLAALIGAGGVCAICLAGLATFGRLTPVPFPYQSPPGPTPVPEYDYASAGRGGDYAPLLYAFTRRTVYAPPPPAPPAMPSPPMAPVNWSNPLFWNHSWAPIDAQPDSSAGRR